MTTTDWVQAVSMIVLVIVTGIYAWRTHVISKATKEQAEEMKGQRLMASRPIIVQRAISYPEPPEGYEYYFEIFNDGNVPAIELEIILLGKDKNQLQMQKETFFLRAREKPISFYPTGLESQIDSTCYLVSQYRGILSGELEHIWYQTWLPFVPKKPQSRKGIILQPKELKFCEVFEKEDY